MKGILLIHGFGGSRRELKALYDFIKCDDYKIELPVLKGHENTRLELSKAKYTEWLDSAEHAYQSLCKSCDDITVVGFSMGGLIAVNLYKNHKFNKLVLVNTPVYYFNPPRIVNNLRKDFKHYCTHYRHVFLSRPLHSLIEFQKLLSKTKPMFKTIDGNTLVIQVQDDDTVNASSGEYIFKRIKGKKQFIKPDCGGHIIFNSECAEEIAQEIDKFIKR